MSAAKQTKGDIEVNGKKYRKIDISDAGETKFWTNATYRYFEWQPIKWKVLKTDGKEAKIQSVNALDCKEYQEATEDSFYDLAFSKEEMQGVINGSGILLSRTEATDESLGFCPDENCRSSTRWAMATDYCHAMGAWTDTDAKYTGGNTNSWWWLSDTVGNSTDVMRVYGSGNIYTAGVDADSSDVAVVPTIVLNLSSKEWRSMERVGSK